MFRLFFILLSFILSSCAIDPDGYLKRSANNKLIDTKGFNAKKRRPIHNKKYITQAKKNVLNNNLIQADEEQDDLSELEDTYKTNTAMYQRMIEQEKNHELSNNKSMFSWLFKTKSPKNKPSLIKQYSTPNKTNVDVSAKQNNSSISQGPLSQDLLNQVTELKLLLNEAKTTLATIQQEQYTAKHSIKNTNNIHHKRNKLPASKISSNSNPIPPKQLVNSTTTISPSKIMTLTKKSLPITAMLKTTQISPLKNSYDVNKSNQQNKTQPSKKLKKIIKKKIVNSKKRPINKPKNNINMLENDSKNT